jgi:phosphopentomutase
MIPPKFKRVILLILDSVGCGYQKDYKFYHCEKCDTLGALYKSKKFSLPNLEKIGLSQIINKKSFSNKSVYGKMIEKTKGNDTFAGTWEMMGVIFNKRFRTLKTGFSKKIIGHLESKINAKIVGNEYISGFKALDKYYDQHKACNGPILYLSDDGVVLLGGHEDVINPEKLNRMGKIFAKELKDINVSRVITRPFIGKKEEFIRTIHRKDFLTVDKLFKHSALFNLYKKKIKIFTTEHIFNILGQPQEANYLKGSFHNKELQQIITKKIKTRKGMEVMLFCLQDFDMLGHSKNVIGYRKQLKEFDNYLPRLLKVLRKDDLLIITADHGCDPCIDIRGHSREHVPLIVYSPSLKGNIDLGTRRTFADIGQTISFNYNLPFVKNGKPFYEIF